MVTKSCPYKYIGELRQYNLDSGELVRSEWHGLYDSQYHHLAHDCVDSIGLLSFQMEVCASYDLVCCIIMRTCVHKWWICLFIRIYTTIILISCVVWNMENALLTGTSNIIIASMYVLHILTYVNLLYGCGYWRWRVIRHDYVKINIY